MDGGLATGFSTRLGPRLSKDWREGVERLHILPRRSWKVIGAVFAGLLFAMIKDLGCISRWRKERGWFDTGLMIFILALWLFWFVAFVGEFFGTEIVSVERGELVISRGIGRLRRTFRYRVGDIAEMVSDGPVTDEQAKPHLHHIFRKPKDGAVRFAYGDTTIYFADWLDEAEGETVVRWLKPKLPSAATEPLPYEYGGAATFKP